MELAGHFLLLNSFLKSKQNSRLTLNCLFKAIFYIGYKNRQNNVNCALSSEFVLWLTIAASERLAKVIMNRQDVDDLR